MEKRILTIYAIGGSDCTAGAGIQADIKAASILGVNCMTAITAVTAQNSFGIKKVKTVNPELLLSQLDAMFEEKEPDGIKIGMIGSYENIRIISNFLGRLRKEIPVVLDPVISSSAGGLLLDKEKNIGIDISKIISLYKEFLFPKSTVVTPNLIEAKNIIEVDRQESEKQSLSKEFFENLLYKMNCKAVIVKGGHTEGNEIKDYLVSRNLDGKISISEYTGTKLKCNNLHGTGCIYSTLLISFLAMGYNLKEAFLKTSEMMGKLISQSIGYNLSANSYGPLNLIDFKKYDVDSPSF